jgi:carbon storage regulator
MLVITRRKGEAIVVGDGIEIVVLRSGRDGVRLGVTAPAYSVILDENLKAAALLAGSTSAEGAP